jgi:hypothetical protein
MRPMLRRVATRESVLRSDWPIDDRGGPTVGTKDYPIALDLAVTLFTVTVGSEM